MSKEVDERVVSMQFDNKHFESNVKTSMSTIDKLKQSLDFSGAEKSLEKVTTSTRKMARETKSEFDSYSTGVFKLGDAINKMWSVMEYDIAHKLKNSLFGAVKSLTVTPLTTGFNEYELKMGSIQTIMAGTGESLETVNKYLDELNKYSDQTIYSFQDMTSNIGKFTNAGVKLEDAVLSIKGISNAAALSGANANEASRAMYNFSQALSAGYVKLIDWKSIELANMATLTFKEQLIQAAVAAGTLTKAGDGMYKTLKGNTLNATKNFNDTLQDQWMTSEVLINTLRDYADETTEIGKKATIAATEVKTFSQMCDTLKESAQSGWARTWELIFGNFEEGKAIWTGLSNVIGGFLDLMADARNTLLESAFAKGFTKLTDGLEDVLDITKKVTDPVEKTVDALEDLGAIVDKVIIGDFGNGLERYSKLTEAGWNYYRVQNEVNEKLGDSHRYTEEQIKAQDELIGKTKKVVESTEEKKDETVKLTKEQKEQLKNLVKMDEAGLENLNLTKDQIEALNELRKTAEKLGIPLDEFIDNLDKINGRWLWVESFKNLGNGIIAIFKSIGNAWKEVFDPITADGVFNALGGFHKITSDILNGIENNAENLTRIFKGVFAIVDIFATLFGSTLKLAFQAANAVLSAFGTDVLSVIAWLADGIVVVRNWIDAHNPIIWLFTKLGEALKWVVKAWKTWVKGLKEAKNPGKYIIDGLINGITSGLRKLVSKAKEIATTIIETVKDWLGIHSPSTVFIAIGGFIIAGLVIGLKNGFGILSNVGGDLGSSIIDGIVEAIRKGAETVKNAAGWVGEWIAEKFGGVNFDKIMSMIMGGGLIMFLLKIGEFMEVLGSPLLAIGELLSGVGEGLAEFAEFAGWFNRALKAATIDLLADALFRFAKALLLIVASLIALGIAFAYLPAGAMYHAVGVILVLMLALTGLVWALSRMQDGFVKLSKKGGLDVRLGTISATLISIGVMLLALAASIWLLGKVDWSKAGYILVTAGVFLGAVIVFTLVLSKMKQAATGKQILATAIVINAIAFSMLTLAGAIALLSFIPVDKLERGAWTVGILAVVMGVIAAGLTFLVSFFNKSGITQTTDKIIGHKNKIISKNITKISGIIFEIGVAMLLLTAAIAILGNMDVNALNRGIATLGVMFGALILLIVVVGIFSLKAKTAPADMKISGSIFIGLAVMLLALSSFLIILNIIDWKKAHVGLMSLAVVFGVLVGLMAVMGAFAKSKAGTNIYAKGAGIFMGLGVALLAMSVAMAILGLMSTEMILHATGVLAALTIFLVIVISVIGKINTVIANGNSNGNKLQKGAAIFVGLGVALLAMAVALAIMSFIPIDKLIVASIALGVLMLVFGGMAALSQWVNGRAAKSILNLGICIALLAAALAVLTWVDMNKVMQAVIPLTIIMGVLAVVLASTRKMTKNWTSLMLLTIMIGVLAGAIALLCLFTPEQLTGAVLTVTAMGILIGALMLVSSKLGKVALLSTKGVLFAILQALAIIVPLGLLVWGLANLPGDPWKALAMTLAVAALAGVLIGTTLVLSKLATTITTGAPAILPALGIIALVGVALGVAIAAFVGLVSLGIWGALAAIGAGLSAFWTNAEPFMEGIKTLSPESALGAKYLAEAVCALAGAGLISALTSLLSFGTMDLGKLGLQLQEFGEAMVLFSNTVAGKIDEDAIVAASNAGTILIDMANKLPKTGGLFGLLVGEAGNIATFGTQIVAFGQAMVNFSATVAGKINESAVMAAANAGSIMIELQNKLPKTGGLVQAICGYQDLGVFASNLVSFGSAIADFSATVDGKINESAVMAAANAGSVIAELQNKLPKTGGLVSLFSGSSNESFVRFSDNLPKLGTAIVNFSNNLTGLNVQNVTAASGAIAEITKLGEISSSNLGGTVKQVDKLIDLCNRMGTVDVTGMSSFGDALKAVADNGIKEFINSFKNSEKSATDAVNALITAMITNLDAGYAGFATSGAYVGEGFVTGVEGKWQAAYDAGYSLGLAAKQGTKDATDQNSPSKVFYGLGGFCVDGFVNAFIDNQSKSYSAGSDMANSAVSGLSKALSHVQDVIDSDMDVQPTIRPVLDLSDIKSGVGQMNGLLNSSPLVGAEANISAIRRLSQNNQNGVNLNDVVSAIDKLYDKELPKGDTYNVNGVTYDDGSNIAEAIATIVRAAILERRT